MKGQNRAKSADLKPKYAFRHLVWTAVGSTTLALLIVLFTPTAQHYANKLELWWVGSELEVQMYSVLIYRNQGDPVADVKLRLRLENIGFSSESIQLLYLSNDVTGDSIDLTSTSPIEVGAQSFARDSIVVQQISEWDVFKKIPLESSAAWRLAFKTPGSDEVVLAQSTISELDRLHYFLMPAGRFYPDNRAEVKPLQLTRVRNLHVLDSTEWIDLGADSFVVMIYPPKEVAVELDTNSDGTTDLIVIADELDPGGGTPGRINAIRPNLEHYFNKVSGFAFAIGGNQILPDSVLFEWYSKDQVEDLAMVFGSIVDDQIPLIGKEFIYWQFSID